MIDEAVSAWLHGNAHPALTQVLLWVTHAHDTAGLLAAGLVMAFILWRKRQHDWLILLALALPGVRLLNIGLKHIFQRSRPVFEQPLLELETYSFPSGHAAGTAVLYAFIAMWWISRHPAHRVPVIAGAAFMVLLVAFSRVYLGVHYPSDVLAGIVVGLAWLWLCWKAVRKIS